MPEVYRDCTVLCSIGVRALLLGKGLEPKTHEGALRLLGLHFVKPGIVSTPSVTYFRTAHEVSGRGGL